MPDKLPRAFYDRPTLKVARDLIGMHLVRVYQGMHLIGRIVETEAYQGPQDLAAHSARGLTARNEVMFGPAGHAYVYLIYGIWHCVNVVVRQAGVPHAVLIRAVEPIVNVAATTHGPGLLCRAFHIDRQLNGADLLGGTVWLERPEDARRVHIQRATRIGVDYAGDWAHKPWRFFDRDSPHVSTLTSAQRKRLSTTRAMSPS